ncbi:hypothetical protein SDC9_99956 [bioreactor metagenome]|uniref:Uncharacterized protein n=1 Tax=bioreactor metagenome TaxID=1076179 RepID=A0A645ALJ9_9ZZZZ
MWEQAILGTLEGVQAPHDAVGVDLHVHMAELGRAPSDQGQRGIDCGIRVVGAASDGQHHLAAVDERLRKRQIVAGVVGIGLAEQHVQADGARLLIGYLVDDLRVQRAPPWPAADHIDAAIIDGDDHDVGANLWGMESTASVMHQMVHALQCVIDAQPTDQAQQHQRQQRPLASLKHGPTGGAKQIHALKDQTLLTLKWFAVR